MDAISKDISVLHERSLAEGDNEDLQADLTRLVGVRSCHWKRIQEIDKMDSFDISYQRHLEQSFRLPLGVVTPVPRGIIQLDKRLDMSLFWVTQTHTEPNVVRRVEDVSESVSRTDASALLLQEGQRLVEARPRSADSHRLALEAFEGSVQLHKSDDSLAWLAFELARTVTSSIPGTDRPRAADLVKGLSASHPLGFYVQAICCDETQSGRARVAELLSQSAELGFAPAVGELGHLHEESDPELAMTLFRRGAELGDERCCERLISKLKGEGGHEGEIFRFSLLGARVRSSVCLVPLADCFASGIGVRPDAGRAKFLLQLKLDTVALSEADRRSVEKRIDALV